MQLWENFLNSLENEIGKEIVDKWLRPFKIVHFDALSLVLKAQDSFQALWFEEHIRAKARDYLKNSKEKPLKIKIEVEENKEELPSSSNVAATLECNYDPLNPSYTFENFILWEKNFLTFQIFSELVGFDFSTYNYDPDNSQQGIYNPIYLHGEIGSGKTHLLHATTLAMQKQNIHVLYVKAETFTEHMIKAMRIGQMQKFRDTYRNSDVFIVDNIEHFANKTATQEEFFHTFNHYHTSGKQVILASKLAPKKLEKIEPRLVSRFEWGIVVSLEELIQDKLPLFLLKKMDLYQLALSKELKDYLLSTFKKPSLLEKALETLSFKSDLENRSSFGRVFHLDEGRAIVHKLKEDFNQKSLSCDGIIEAVLDTFDVNREEILGKSQTKEAVLPRQLAMYLLRNKLKMPYVKIGKVFARDHSTVISSVRLIAKGIKNKENKILQRLDHLEKKLV